MIQQFTATSSSSCGTRFTGAAVTAVKQEAEFIQPIVSRDWEKEEEEEGGVEIALLLIHRATV